MDLAVALSTPDEGRISMELIALIVGCLLGVACLGLLNICWWSARAEFCPVCIRPDEESSDGSQPRYFNTRPWLRCCEYGYRCPPPPPWLKKLLAKFSDLSAMLKRAWTRCGGARLSSCCRGGGAGGGEEGQNLLEAGLVKSDGSSGPPGSPGSPKKKASARGASRGGYVAFMSGAAASCWGSCMDKLKGGGGGGGSGETTRSFGGTPSKLGGGTSRSRSPSPDAKKDKESKAKFGLDASASGREPTQRKAMGMSEIDAQLDAQRNGKYNCVSRLWHDCMLSLRQKSAKNFQVAKTFNHWHDQCARANAMRQNMRNSLHSLVYRQERMALHGWIDTVEEKKEMLAKLRKGLSTLTQTAERRALNSWHEMASEKKAKMEKIERVLRRASPEGKAKLRVIYELRDQLYRAQAMKKALFGFVNRAYISAFNKWCEVVKEQAAKNEKIKAALARMSPEGRAMLKVIEKLQEIQRAAYAMRRAINMFSMSGPLWAFNTWKSLQSRRTQGMQSTVWLAAQRGHRVGALQEMFEALEPTVVEELIRATDEVGMTPLLWAAKRGFGDVVEVLLAFGADAAAVITAGDADGSTALHHAARKSHNDIVQLLLNSGGNVNAVNLDHSTPLHWAARKNNTGAIKMLLDAGADLESRNKWGATALDNAKFADHMGSIVLLATDAATRKAAETKLVLENKLRPTAEERAAKLAELASDALARREDNRSRLLGIKEIKEEKEAATKEKAQLERRQRNADRALAVALSPTKGGKPGGPPGAIPADAMMVADEGDEVAVLEAAIAESREAGNAGVKGAAAERLRAADLRLEELRAERTLPGTPAGAGINSHRTPGKTPVESPIERTLRRQKLAAMRKK